MKPWKTIKREPVIQNQWLTVENHTVELPNGSQIEGWQWVVVPDYVNVIAQTPEGKFICFRQTKYAVPDTSLAPVGGIIEKGEAPLAAAKRELLEELGYESEDWIFLGSYATEANRGVGVGHIYLARNVIISRKRSSDDLEEQEPVELSEDEMRSALIAGEYKVISWAASIGLALAYVGTRVVPSRTD